MPEPEAWIAVASDGTITGWDTEAAALNALRDDPGDVWVERVRIRSADTHAPQEREEARRGPNGARRG